MSMGIDEIRRLRKILNRAENAEDLDELEKDKLIILLTLIIYDLIVIISEIEP